MPTARSLASSDCDFRTGGLPWRTCRTDRGLRSGRLLSRLSGSQNMRHGKFTSYGGARRVRFLARFIGEVRVRFVPPRPEHYYLASNSLMNELHECLVFERFCEEAESSRIECGLAH